MKLCNGFLFLRFCEVGVRFRSLAGRAFFLWPSQPKDPQKTQVPAAFSGTLPQSLEQIGKPTSPGMHANTTGGALFDSIKEKSKSQKDKKVKQNRYFEQG